MSKTNRIVVSLVSDLFSARVGHGDLVETTGYSVAGTGANLYRYDSGSSATVDYGFVLDGVGGNGTGTGVGRFIAVDQTQADVTKFGALGDGTTDDTVAIQRAINVVLPDRGVVYIPTGQYAISATLLIDTTTTAQAEAIHIYGDGPLNSRIIRAASFTGSSMLASNTNSVTSPTGTRLLEGATFRDFGITCNYTSTAVDRGIYFPGFIHSKMERVWVRGAGKAAFSIEYSYSNVYDQCRADNNYLHGFVFGHESALVNNTTLTGCISVNNAGVAYYFDGGYANEMIGCGAETSEMAGIYVGHMQGLHISGLYAELNAQTGHSFTTFSGGSLYGGPWLVKADIILNGSGQKMDASTYALPTDVSFAYPTTGVTISGNTQRDPNVYFLALCGAKGVNVTSYSALDSINDVLFHASHKLAENVTIGGYNRLSPYLFDIGRTELATKFQGIEFQGVDLPVIETLPANFVVTQADAGGSLASSAFTYRGKTLYRLGDTASDGQGTDFYGKTIDLGEYRHLRGQYVSHLCEWFPAFNFDDTYPGLYDSNMRMVAEGIVDTGSVVLSNAAEIQTTGTITGGTNSLVVASASGMQIGDWIIICKAGVGTNKSAHFSKITNIAGTTITLADNATTSVTSQIVRTVVPRMSYMTVLVPSSSATTKIGVQRNLGRAGGAVYISSLVTVPFGVKWPFMGN